MERDVTVTFVSTLMSTISKRHAHVIVFAADVTGTRALLDGILRKVNDLTFVVLNNFCAVVARIGSDVSGKEGDDVRSVVIVERQVLLREMKGDVAALFRANFRFRSVRAAQERTASRRVATLNQQQ